MASKRFLKKKVRGMVFEVLNDCDFVIVNGGSTADRADQLIDEAVDFHDATIAKINGAKTKKDFGTVKEDINKSELNFIKKLNALNK